jgi:nitroimidazol reductase NimA-like FMN-containing flavoprotein (pyridoxamine 5'-phosphate oxidase superfamily)
MKHERLNNMMRTFFVHLGMKKTRQEILDPAVLEEILAGATICRLAMTDGELPYILPFNFGYRDGYIYIHSAPEGKKMDLLKREPRVAFEVEQGVRVIKKEKACGWATCYRSVVGHGTVEIIGDEPGKQAGLEILMAQHGAPHLKDFEAGNMQRMVILKLRIHAMTGKQSDNWDQAE